MTLQEFAEFVRGMREAQTAAEECRPGTIDHARASGAAGTYEDIVDGMVARILDWTEPAAWTASPASPCVASPAEV